VGITDANGNCANGVNTGGENPMVHVWVTPHPCGVFAALEGSAPAKRPCPMTNALTCATSRTLMPPQWSLQAVRPDAADRSRGVPGVTPEQQAAAENLVALNVVRLPQWADYKTAEAAGITASATA
jgi:hypothetical protein